jgi:hypothetical protein
MSNQKEPYFFKNGDKGWMLMYDQIPREVWPLMDEREGVTGTFVSEPFKCNKDVNMWYFEVDKCNVSFILGDFQPKEVPNLFERLNKTL